MKTMTRLVPGPTQRVDQSRQIPFTYRGQRMSGLIGDSLATALFANGVRIFSRSLKRHRPRGLYSLDGESSNCLMAVDGIPNVRAETTPLREGLAVGPQNVVGSPEWDWLGFLDRLDWLMPAGFYYRLFHKPAAVWPLALKRIRRAAGIGRVDPQVSLPGRYDELFLNAEVCVLGGGPAGLSAALAAAEQGLRVVLFEARPWLGGFYDWRTREYAPGQSLHERGRELARQVGEAAGVRVFSHAFVNNLCGDNLVTAFQVGGPGEAFSERYIEVRARSVVVASGCLERPLVFENNERPGVMQAGCAHRLARTYGLLPGQNAVVSVGDDLSLEAALDLAEAGLNLAAVADCRPEGQDPGLIEALLNRSVPFMSGWAASSAHGRKVLEAVTLRRLDGKGENCLACDLLIASAGQAPASGPLSLALAKLAYDQHTGFFLPVELPPRLHAAGRLLGYADPAAVEASGRLAGLAAALDCGAPAAQALAQAKKTLAGLPGPARGCNLVFGPDLGRGGRSFVCFDEDGSLKEIEESIRQSFDLPELAKRFTAIGTGPGQGGVPGQNLPLVMARLKGQEPGSLIPTTVRSPLVPTLMATYAGPKHQIFKRSPLHQEQEALGGVFRRIGVWKRARYFSQDFTCRQEIENVRNNVGLIDVSTLGKFRLHGPDALKALQRVYISDMSRMKEGRLKYSGMCNQDGNLVDDGVVARLGEGDYYFTSSTVRAGETIEWFRYQTRFDGWDFHLVNLTDALAAINLAGPRAREVLAKVTEADLSNEAFPFMACQEVTLAGQVRARVLRLGFVGELSYELHLPASQAQWVWNLLLEAGREWGIRPFGLEAQSVLRLEKGHVIIGQESEARTNLLDLGLGFLWDREDTASQKVGAPALRLAQDQPDRLKLVGFKMDGPTQTPADGSLIVEGEEIRGFVGTCRFSATLGQSIGLALARADLAGEGGRLNIYQNDGHEGGRAVQTFTATVVKPPFYDPEGRRLRM